MHRVERMKEELQFQVDDAAAAARSSVAVVASLRSQLQALASSEVGPPDAPTFRRALGRSGLGEPQRHPPTAADFDTVRRATLHYTHHACVISIKCSYVEAARGGPALPRRPG